MREGEEKKWACDGENGGEPGKRSVAADNAMTRDNEWQWVAAYGCAYGSRC